MKNNKSIKSKISIILQKCAQQNKKFQQWNKKKSWDIFHSSHYDWWAFPIDQNSSSHGSAYKVQQKDHQILINDKIFITMLRQNAIFVCKSWGWNLQKGTNYQSLGNNQKWQRWPIRLSKMCRSLEIFQQMDLFKNAILYGIILLKTYKKFTYGGKDLTPYFYQKFEQMKKFDQINGNPHKNKLENVAKQSKQQHKEIKKIQYNSLQKQVKQKRQNILSKQQANENNQQQDKKEQQNIFKIPKL